MGREIEGYGDPSCEAWESLNVEASPAPRKRPFACRARELVLVCLRGSRLDLSLNPPRWNLDLPVRESSDSHSDTSVRPPLETVTACERTMPCGSTATTVTT